MGEERGTDEPRVEEARTDDGGASRALQLVGSLLAAVVIVAVTISIVAARVQDLDYLPREQVESLREDQEDRREQRVERKEERRERREERREEREERRAERNERRGGDSGSG